MDIKRRFLRADKRRQIARMDKVRAFGAQRRAVAAQRQHTGDPGGLELIEQGGRFHLIAAHAQDVGERFDLQLVFEEGGHLDGGHAAPAAAGTVSNADKAGVQVLHLAQRLLHGGEFGCLLGRETLDRKDAALLRKQLRDGRHRDHIPSLNLYNLGHAGQAAGRCSSLSAPAFSSRRQLPSAWAAKVSVPCSSVRKTWMPFSAKRSRTSACGWP